MPAVPEPTRARLGLGTVQFGTAYGVANKTGRPTAVMVRDILTRARAGGIDLLDTAPGYGDSENVLGAAIAPDQPFRIVTKTPAFGAETLGPADGAALIASVEASLARLRRHKLFAVLVHHGVNLLKPGGVYLWNALTALKERGLVDKIGYSAYSPDEIARIQSLFAAEIVQTPVNILDQRLVKTGTLAALKRDGVEVHARSIFLQGLLVMEPNAIPKALAEWAPHLSDLRVWLHDNGMSPLEGCLAFARGCGGIDAVIAGVEHRAQLDEILSAAAHVPGLDFGRWCIEDERLLDPSRWTL
jgi:aryl-alcohol dehydrogenase-like predicted oxidoreductase